MNILLLNPPAIRPKLKARIAKHSKAALIKVLSFAVIVNLFPPIAAHSDFEAKTIAQGLETVIPTSSLVANYAAVPVRIPKKIKVTLTGYSSTPDQTDDTPFITAANTYVHDGVVASNFLPFYTNVKIPEIFGPKLFVNVDRMNSRFNPEISGVYHMDIWFKTRAEALAFGKRTTEILVF